VGSCISQRFKGEQRETLPSKQTYKSRPKHLFIIDGATTI
jgi:hypothetical protein